jgi:hypothetical protein
MSENLPAEKPNTDLSPKDLEKVKQFAADGMPGLAKLGESDFHRMAELYMNGATYWQISSIVSQPRALIMYLSHTYGWFEAKQEMQQEMQEKIKARVIDSKLASQDFILLMIQAYQKRLGAKLRSYLATDDETHADEINLKEIDKLIKAIETLKDLNSDPKPSKGPAIGLNVGDGATIERTGDNKLTITPAIDRQLGDMLKKFADKRREEQAKAEKGRDIVVDKPNEESNNET